MSNELDIVDRVAIFLREMDGNDEIEQCEGYEGDQAFGYRGDAQTIVRIVLKALAERVPERSVEDPVNPGEDTPEWYVDTGFNECRRQFLGEDA